MGSFIEINDTLLLTTAQGFPAALLDVEQHQQTPITLAQVQGQVFTFQKSSARLYHKDPVRLFLVQKIEGKWLFWGHALLQSQSIEKQEAVGDDVWCTKGSFIISKIYAPAYQRLATLNETPGGLSYF